MGEQLLRAPEIAARLGISTRQFHRLKSRLMADGLQQVDIAGTASESTPRYRESSLDKLIKRAAEKGRSL